MRALAFAPVPAAGRLPAAGHAPPRVPAMRLHWRVLARIRARVGQAPFETGGPLGMNAAGEIAAFRFDDTAAVSATAYTPDVVRLNRLFRRHWNPRGVRVAGFVHSHPPGFLEPSDADRLYAVKLLAALPWLEAFYLPIVRSGADGGGFQFRPFAAVRDTGQGARVAPCGLIVVG